MDYLYRYPHMAPEMRKRVLMEDYGVDCKCSKCRTVVAEQAAREKEEKQMREREKREQLAREQRREIEAGKREREWERTQQEQERGVTGADESEDGE